MSKERMENMCYKEEKQLRTARKLKEKMSDMPVFIQDFFNRQKSKTTSNTYWCYIKDMLRWMIDNKYIEKEFICDITKEDLDNINSSNIISYLDDLLMGITVRKNSQSTVAMKKNVIGAFWTYLFTHHFVYDNVVQMIPKNRFAVEESNEECVVEIPTEEELESFLSNLQEGDKRSEFNIVRDLAIVKLFLGSGIRSEELINLDLLDLHLDEEYPYIMVLGKGKQKIKDKVFISPEAKDYLLEYLRSRNIFLKENNIIKEDALFLSNEKTRISKTAITHFFSKYSGDIIYPHMLRHLVGTKLYEKTKDIVLVQKQLRHKSLEVAVKFYVHMKEDTVADAMKELW